MLNLRHALAATVAAVALVPAGHVQASIGGDEAIHTLATDAADLLAEELTLVEQATSPGAVSPAELDAVRSQLRAVDGLGQSVLVQLRNLGVSLTPAIETTLERLPDLATGDTTSVSVVPEPVVYQAAIDDLVRIAATPSAVTAGGDDSNGPSYALLLVAAVSLLILGAAALANTLWRRTDPGELDALAWSDGLTGLATRRRLDHDLQTAAGNAPTSVIMIDVDHFQSVNDSYGHQTGDDVLKRLGTVFEHHVRMDDVVYRYGGEEFCVLLPGADAAEARLVANRIVEAAREVDLPNGANVTVSVGIAGGVGNELEDAIEHADHAVHLAKQQGRDRAVHADEQLVAG
ncbi:MAG: GGDEF domain-containing protein [Ilumatobacteraceae bacterium]|nr:GGDEF domain-containing protein [Ilumatobacteraceae bacterium]